MTTDNNNNDNNDAKPPDPSPNPSDKKRHKTDSTSTDEEEMDLETVQKDLLTEFTSSATQPNPTYDTSSDATMTPTDPRPKIKQEHNFEGHTIIVIDDDSDDDTGKTSENNNDDDDPNDEEKTDLAPKTIFDIPIKEANERWNNINKRITKTLKPYKEEDFTDTSTGSLILRLAEAATLMGQEDEEDLATPDEWYELFDSIRLNELKGNKSAIARTRDTMYRLAVSDPFVLIPADHWNSGGFWFEHEVVNAWTAVYCLFGAPWKNRDDWIPKISTPSE